MTNMKLQLGSQGNWEQFYFGLVVIYSRTRYSFVIWDVLAYLAMFCLKIRRWKEGKERNIFRPLWHNSFSQNWLGGNTAYWSDQYCKAWSGNTAAMAQSLDMYQFHQKDFEILTHPWHVSLPWWLECQTTSHLHPYNTSQLMERINPLDNKENLQTYFETMFWYDPPAETPA